MYEQKEAEPASDFLAEDKFACEAGIELIKAENGIARVSMKIEEKHKNSHGTVHGGVDQCRAAIDFAGSDFRLLSVSRPGFLGTPLESGKSLDEQADLFAAVLDELGIDKVAVFSISAGGLAAYTFAARHPDRIWAPYYS